MKYYEIVTPRTAPVKKTVKTAINVSGPCGAYFSIDTYKKENPRSIDLVIGANYQYRAASAFDKDSLKELIDLLVDIHEAMV
jgi:hypothetical protein